MKTLQKLSQHQLDFFDTFGYLAFPGLLNDCIDKIIEEFEDVWAKSGRTHDRTTRSALIPFPDQNEYLSSLLDDHRIHDIASSLCGEDFNYYSGDGNYYVGDTDWHSDGYNTRIVRMIKIAFYLDPVRKNTGALRVIPGSHKTDDTFANLLQSHLKGTDEAPSLFGITGDQIPAVALESTPGDILVFNQNIKHSSWGGSDRRRMFTMNFSERYPDNQLHRLREDIGKSARFWIERKLGPVMINTATPERMHHLQQVRENDTHLPDLVKELKKTMKEPANG
tara:strand:- start:1902 stop:2741 length:840 start_codon:yes stop_codon:yes gene_type:complete